MIKSTSSQIDFISQGRLTMGKHTIFATLALTFVWVILMERFSWQNVATGMFMSMLSMHFMGKFFGFEEIKNVNFYKLAIYPFWLVCRIYMDAFFLTKLILSDAKWGIMKEQIQLENDALCLMLADSITLTPGSVYLDRNGKEITLLCIGSKKNPGYPASVEGLRSIERMLLRSQKSDEV